MKQVPKVAGSDFSAQGVTTPGVTLYVNVDVIVADSCCTMMTDDGIDTDPEDLLRLGKQP